MDFIPQKAPQLYAEGLLIFISYGYLPNSAFAFATTLSIVKPNTL